MALYSNSTNISITNSQYVVPATFTTRASLPTGAAGYLAYVQDQAEFVVNTGAGVADTGIESGVKWYRFLVKPMDYKNETIIEQGTVANGYVGSSIYNTIHRIVHSQDILQLMTQTTPFTSKYGGWHSTELYAYYHQGNNEGATTQGAAKQSWATAAMTTLTNRATLTGNAMNSTQPGPKLSNTVGVLLQSTSSCYISFATDAWVIGGYNISGGTNYGWGTFGQNYGYTWNSGYSNTYKLNWGNSTWAAGAGSPSAGGTSSLGKALNTKWEKFYHVGDQGTQQTSASKHNNSNDTWTSLTTTQINPQVEQSMCMGQDWGYLLGGYGPSGSWSGQNAYSQKMMYVSDTISRTGTRMDGANALSSGNACWGPM